jgi:hypothetical protein
MTLLHDPSYLLGQTAYELWCRHGTFACRPDDVAGIVSEFEQFVDQERVRLRFFAQLLNFRCDSDSIELPDDLRIRRLADAEVTAIHGGSILAMGTRPGANIGIHDFVIEGEAEEDMGIRRRAR